MKIYTVTSITSDDGRIDMDSFSTLEKAYEYCERKLGVSRYDFSSEWDGKRENIDNKNIVIHAIDLYEVYGLGVE